MPELICFQPVAGSALGNFTQLLPLQYCIWPASTLKCSVPASPGGEEHAARAGGDNITAAARKTAMNDKIRAFTKPPSGELSITISKII
jgi:hypothetical protein